MTPLFALVVVALLLAFAMFVAWRVRVDHRERDAGLAQWRAAHGHRSHAAPIGEVADDPDNLRGLR